MTRRARTAEALRGRRRLLATLCLVFALAAVLAAVPRPAAGTATLGAWAVSGTPTADPGDVVTFTISINNVGPSFAANVWANATVPPFTTYVSETVGGITWFSGEWFSGNRRGWNFTNLPAANHTFDLTLRVLVGPADQTVLPLSFFVNYTDDAGLPRPESAASASVKVVIPTILITKTPTVDPVDPGQSLSYSVVVSNWGNTTSNTIWLNDTLPPQVTFVSVSGIQPSRCTGPNCRVLNLPARSQQTYSINVRVASSAVRGTGVTNNLFANYTDNDDTVLGSVSTSASVTVRVLTDLTIGKVPDAPFAFRGQTITFTIWYNDTSASALGATWINDTLPLEMTHDRSTPTGTVAGNTVRWQFPNVATGPHSLLLVVRISASATNGSQLTNVVTGNYVDGAGQPGQQVQAGASIVVAASLPAFEFAKTAAPGTAAPGATVRFTVYYNNTGTNTSAAVVIDDTIPQGTVLTNPSETVSGVVGRRYTWRFTNVVTGGHSITYDLVLQNVAVNTTLVNFAFLNFTDPFGSPLSPPGSRSAVVHVAASNGGGSGGISPLTLVVGTLIALAVAGLLGYRVVAAKRQTVIDEVFLLHRDGLLIKHYTRRMRPDVDSDILSGMLIAVQNFVNESFIGAEGLQREGVLDELRFGEFKIVLERGQWVIVAAVLSGDPTNRVKDEVKAAIRALETALGPELEGWRGDMRSVEGADRYVQDLITGKYRHAWGKG
ncbi:MAG: DUF11 domain-containing protein [Methanobacteriota archaeon]|nr:MAG: DUF11 domain-containing protein [Euryarchaeota archaeon]